MSTFTISRVALRAVSMFAAKKDERWYLNGVYFEAMASRTRLVATNGHILAVHDYHCKNQHIGSGILPLDDLQPIIKNKKGSETFEVEVIERCRVKIADGAAAYDIQLFDAKFPDYRRVVAETTSGEPAVYSADYVKRVADAVRVLGGGRSFLPLQVHQNGEGSGVFKTDLPNFLAIVMPMRPKNGHDYDLNISWVFEDGDQ